MCHEIILPFYHQTDKLEKPLFTSVYLLNPSCVLLNGREGGALSSFMGGF